LETTGNSLQVAGTSLGPHRHICAFFNGLDEQHRVLRSFIKDALDRGDKAFHLLEVRAWQDGPLRGGRFDQDIWLASFEQVLQSGPAAGYGQTLVNYVVIKYAGSAN
jgi:hypothetical protein